MIKTGRLCIYVLFVSIHLYGCGPTTYVNYNKPEFSDKTALDDFIGVRKGVLLKYFGSPEQVLARDELSYYLYSGTGKAVPLFFFVIPGFLPVGMQHCLLLEFDKENVFRKYYLYSYDNYTCDYIIRLHGIKPAIEKDLLTEDKIGNAAGQWELYKRRKSRGVHDFKLLCSAAEKGDYRARWELGYLYHNGLYGARKNLVLSVMWYSLVEAAGHDPKGVDNIREQLTPEELTEAEHLYDNWIPGQCERDLVPDNPRN